AVPGRVPRDIVELRRLRDRVSVFDHALDMERQLLRRHPARFIEGFSGGDATRKIGKAYAVIGIPVLMKIGDIFHGCGPLLLASMDSPKFGLPQLDPGLFLDTF